MTRTSFRSLSSFALLGALSLGPLTACGDDGATDDANTSGSAGASGKGQGGSTAGQSSAGSAGASVAGSAGTMSGSSGHAGSTAGTGGQSGAGQGGTAGDGGSAGAAGDAGTAGTSSSGTAGAAGEAGAAGASSEGGGAGTSAQGGAGAGGSSGEAGAGSAGDGGQAGAGDGGQAGTEAGSSGSSGHAAGVSGQAGTDTAGGAAGTDAGGQAGSASGGQAGGGGGDAGHTTGGAAGSASSECTTADECPGQDGDCTVRTCTAGVCGVGNREAGFELDSAPGDCKKSVCDGEGNVVSQSDDDDPPESTTCASNKCLLGAVLPIPSAAGKACTEGGGHVCDGKGACVACTTGGDCASGVCTGNVCQASTCSDTVRNGAETDTDCGGGTCATCALGKQCKATSDCKVGVCQDGVCAIDVAAVGGGESFTCAARASGVLKCWGRNYKGQLGYGDTAGRGYGVNQMGTKLPAVELGAGSKVTAISRGQGSHVCAILATGAVKCWGNNDSGQLGLGDTNHRGDGAGEMGDALPTVNLGTGRTAVQVAAGSTHTCARLDNGAVKCWGNNGAGQLGLGDTSARGDGPGEMGDGLPAVDLGTGRTATEIRLGGDHTCAILDDGSLKCWGYGGDGRLGTFSGNVGVAPGQMGDALLPVRIGTGRTVKAVALGDARTCALLDDGAVKCFGYGADGGLGYGDTSNHGSNSEIGDTLAAIDLGTGAVVQQLKGGSTHTCALLASGALKCWGVNGAGQLGLGDTSTRGDGPGEMGDSLPAIALGTGRTVLTLVAFGSHSCAVLDDGSLKCWGTNESGELGLGNDSPRGDGPGEMGDSLPAVSF